MPDTEDTSMKSRDKILVLIDIIEGKWLTLISCLFSAGHYFKQFIPIKLLKINFNVVLIGSISMELKKESDSTETQQASKMNWI